MRTVVFERLFSAPLRNGVSYPAKLRGTGVPMVNMKEIFAFDRLGMHDYELAPLTASERREYMLADGDLLFARQSLTYEGAGKCSLVLPNESPRTWESHLIRVRLDKSVAHSPYYYYYFRSPMGRRLMGSIVQQVAAAGIRGSDLKRLEVPHPPLVDQKAIADVLGSIDDKIAANERAVDSASRVGAAEFSLGTANALVAPMSMVLKPHLGGTPSRAVEAFWEDAGHPWVSVKDMTAASSGVLLTTAERISDEAILNKRTSLQPEGSVLLSARGTVGKVVRLAMPAAINQSCYSFAPGVIPPGCLFHVIQGVSAQARAFAHGSVFDTITMRTFDHLSVPDLTAEDWAKLEAQIDPVMASIVGVERESKRLADMRDALLPLLMSGKLRVKDVERTLEEVL